MTTKKRNIINGVILLDKPLEISSNGALRRIKYLLNTPKVGHTGTLDPLATGLLPVCLGEATKFASFLLDGDKEYLATAKLGVLTTTGDSEGEILIQNEVNVSHEEIQEVLQKFIGNIIQTPPMFSALKHEGVPLYEYARTGITIERKQREIKIHELELLEYNQSTQELTFRALVSKGTYIRTLAEDIGKALGVGGASLTMLRRTQTNHFDISEANTIQQLEEQSYKLLPVDSLLFGLDSIDINAEQFRSLTFGHPSKLDFIPNITDDRPVRCYYNNQFLGIVNYVYNDNQWYLKPKRLMQHFLAQFQ